MILPFHDEDDMLWDLLRRVQQMEEDIKKLQTRILELEMEVEDRRA